MLVSNRVYLLKGKYGIFGDIAIVRCVVELQPYEVCYGTHFDSRVVVWFD